MLFRSVTDFRHTEWLKKFINENIDHQFIIDKDDPLINKLIDVDTKVIPVLVPDTAHVAGWKIDLTDVEPNTPDYEYKEGFFIVDFVPTSENLSSWMAKLVDVKMAGLGVRVHHIDWWETPKSRSVYYND